MEHPSRPEPRFSWFIPIDGDGSRLGTLKAERPPTFDYLKKVVLTAEDEGFYSQLIPTRFANGLFHESAPLAETWTTATALAAVTSRIRFLVAVRPGFVSVGLFAQMAAALHQISGGRLDINVVPGGIQNDFERLGEGSDHDSKYARAEEFIAACRLLWSQPGPVSFQGRFYKLDGAYCEPRPEGEQPKFYLGGVSGPALELAGRQADVHLSWIEPVEATAKRVADSRARFLEEARTPAFGLRTHLVVRDTESEAWEAADDLIAHADAEVKAQRQAVFSNTPMVGQRAQAQPAPNHRVDRHLWNGLSEVRVNCGTAIVGDPEQAAAELVKYWELGIDEFILSGFPHVEECRRAASDVIPLVKRSASKALAA